MRTPAGPRNTRDLQNVQYVGLCLTTVKQKILTESMRETERKPRNKDKRY
ncbi:hypothetical protein H5410_028444 [Solanum commersonii]|uniref:Uncharacterized protein n=1 Tax=Solanum commersonii TaxID=4109 RepID=A0A9J5Z4U9_SOLCO|nr:hypothetical protein H5410_028444 [Solanum commersonii]